MNKKVRIGLFGQVSVRVNDREITKFSTSRVRELVVALALARGEPCTRDSLVAKLWPGSYGSNERNRLAVALYTLRKYLVEPGSDQPDPIIADSDTISLSIEHVECDLWDFHDALAEGEQASDDKTRDELFRKAASFYTSELARLVTKTWINTPRDFARNRHADACYWLFQRASSVNDEASAYEWLQKMLLTDPQSTRTQEANIRWLLAKGEIGRAMDGAVAMREKLNEKKIPLAGRVEALVHEVEERWIDEGPSEPQSLGHVPTLSILLADSDAQNLDDVANQFDGLRQDAGASVFKNPIVAKQAAQRLLQRLPRARLYLSMAVMNPTDEVTGEMRQTHRQVPEGQLWLSRAAAAMVEDCVDNAVFERTDVRKNYRLI